MNYYIESQLQKMSQLLEQKQSEINKLKAQVEKYQNYDQQLEELNQYIMQLNYQFQQQEQTHKDQIYFMQRELAFAQDEIKNLQRTRGQNEQQQIASLLKELSEIKQENNQLKVELSKQQQKPRTNSIQENSINDVKRLSPHMRVHNCSFTSPSQNLVKERRVPSLPDVNSNRLSINKTSFHNLSQNQTYSKKPPLQQIHNISPNKQLLIVRQ
ncbi:unnamed protein product [Paramecium pentaurelia]|uniref:Uncharacterized protein n=1 Tax=Paramecium pentaurelia TaxID=43138 RepID=A0A8S1SWF6_9CILI|nr:unnamed protein product [Paramecium pentaurelia]